MQMLNNWSPVAIILLGYVVGLYFQNKRLDDFKEGLYKYLGAEFESVRTELRTEVKRLEDKIDHLERPVVKP